MQKSNEKNRIKNRRDMSSTQKNQQNHPNLPEPIRQLCGPTYNEVRDQLFQKNVPESSPLHPLKLVLWSKDKTKKLLDFSCAPEPHSFCSTGSKNDSLLSRPDQPISGPNKKLGKINVKVLRSNTGKVRLKFLFETPESSAPQIRESDRNLRIEWKAHNHNLRYQLDLDEHLTKHD